MWLDIWDATAGLDGSAVGLGSALAWHGIIDTIPKRVHVAVPRGAVPTKPQRLPVEYFEVDPATADYGRGMTEVNRGCDVLVYGLERSLVDAVLHGERLGSRWRWPPSGDS